MGFVKLKQRLRHTIKPIFFVFVFVFLIGGIFSFDAYQRGRDQGGGTRRKVPKVVATVNGEKIGREELDYQLWMAQERFSGIPPELRRMLVTQWFEGRVDSILMRQAERREKIRVSDKEAEAKRMEEVDRLLAPQIEQRASLAQRLEREGLTLEQFRKKTALERFPDLDPFRDEVAGKKLEDKIKSAVTVTDQQLRDSFTEVKGRHILIDPKALQRKAESKLDQEKTRLEDQLAAAQKAGKTPDSALQKRLDAIQAEKQALTGRSWDGEARKKAEALRRQVLAGGDFAKLARESSDDTGSGSQGGDLGFFKQGRMVPEFDKAAFSLKPGAVSDPVKSDFGYHIIQVQQRKQEIPKDFEKNKKTHQDQYLEERKWQVWGQYRQQLREAALIVVGDPEVQAYRLLAEQGDPAKVIPLLESALEQDPANTGAMWELAQLRRERGDDDEALKLLQQAEKVEGARPTAELMITIGELLQEKKQNAPAIDYFTKASDLAAPLEAQNEMVHRRLETAFKQLGRKDLAAQEAEWLKKWQKAQAEQGFGGAMFGPGGTFTVP